MRSKRLAQKHEDTRGSLHPLSFDEAMEALAHAPKQTDSPAAESDSTKSGDRDSVPPKRRWAREIAGVPGVERAWAYFNNDAGGHAPRNALRLRELAAPR